MRGQRVEHKHHLAVGGSIPACAGATSRLTLAGFLYEVYPRVCGGNLHPQRGVKHQGGLSPRVRGQRSRPSVALVNEGSIPACAGETATAASQAQPCSVYPRVCGGNLPAPLSRSRLRGLSPRVRGKPHTRRQPQIRPGSIPACAGETQRRGNHRRSAKVYPRVCGGNRERNNALLRRKGLSPRVRGKPGHPAAGDSGGRSIPACAGETAIANGWGEVSWVYPRVCGGNPAAGPPSPDWPALSPRVRGKPASRIPHPASRILKVYPRVCGGTGAQVVDVHDVYGLSPRVRGNPPTQPAPPTPSRSIPACAGETFGGSSCAISPKVYPRVCGGNDPPTEVRLAAQGLSPRVRGKPKYWSAPSPSSPSIPACAGETPWCQQALATPALYPRVCGGNPLATIGAGSYRGLSPRVRGKLLAAVRAPFRQRSIPACAGETTHRPRFALPLRVYPRVCGGNEWGFLLAPCRTGLSPRVRGKPGSQPRVDK